MFVSGSVRPLWINVAGKKCAVAICRTLLCFFIATGSLLISAVSASAQADAAGGGARQKTPTGGRVRIEATASLRWNKAPFDTGNGASTYWFHASAASGNKKISGGFTVNIHPRMLGNFIDIQVNGVQVDKISAKERLPLDKPSVARIIGSCVYGEKTYNVQIDVVGDYKPASGPGGKGAMVRGSIRLKMSDVRSKASFDAVGAERSSVSIWLN